MSGGIGALVRSMRKEAGLSQTDLAERMHTTQRTISRLENAVLRVRIDLLTRAALAMGKQLKIEVIANEAEKSAKR